MNRSADQQAFDAADAVLEPDHRKPAPQLEQHTRELLREFEYDESQSDTLIFTGVIAEP